MNVPMLSMTWIDPETGIQGYLVIHRTIRGVAAGGLRLHADVSIDELAALAHNMTLKQAVAGIRVGGAKAGLRLSPTDPRREQVLGRFLGALAPLVNHVYSVGPDVNTTLHELERLGQHCGLPCLKIAVGRSRGIQDDEFVRRYALFEGDTPRGKVNALRGATAVVAACRVSLESQGGSLRGARVAVQGAGSMGGATAALLAQGGASVVAWADEVGCFGAPDGLPVEAMLRERRGGRLPDVVDGAVRSSRESVLFTECDLLVLAATSHAISVEHSGRVKARQIVQAANLALELSVEERLQREGVLIIPDIVASSGGSLAVEALYSRPIKEAQEILVHVDERAAQLTRHILALARERSISTRAAALAEANAVLQAEGVL
jgi:glutamate dehydrogenase (NAD(P)+)